MVKRENAQILESIFLMFLMNKNRVSPQCHTFFLKKKSFYEHGFRCFRSAGMFMSMSKYEYDYDVSVYIYIYNIYIYIIYNIIYIYTYIEY